MTICYRSGFGTPGSRISGSPWRSSGTSKGLATKGRGIATPVLFLCLLAPVQEGEARRGRFLQPAGCLCNLLG